MRRHAHAASKRRQASVQTPNAAKPCIPCMHAGRHENHRHMLKHAPPVRCSSEMQPHSCAHALLTPAICIASRAHLRASVGRHPILLRQQSCKPPPNNMNRSEVGPDRPTHPHAQQRGDTIHTPARMPMHISVERSGTTLDRFFFIFRGLFVQLLIQQCQKPPDTAVSVNMQWPAS